MDCLQPVDEPPETRATPTAEDSLQYFQRLGLGMGVNIAEHKPWLHRSTYPVRAVHASNIAEINMGFSREHERKVKSTFAAHLKFGAAFDLPNSSISIGTDEELWRSASDLTRVRLPTR